MKWVRLYSLKAFELISEIFSKDSIPSDSFHGFHVGMQYQFLYSSIMFNGANRTIYRNWTPLAALICIWSSNVEQIQFFEKFVAAQKMRWSTVSNRYVEPLRFPCWCSRVLKSANWRSMSFISARKAITVFTVRSWLCAFSPRFSTEIALNNVRKIDFLLCMSFTDDSLPFSIVLPFQRMCQQTPDGRFRQNVQRSNNHIYVRSTLRICLPECAIFGSDEHKP